MVQKHEKYEQVASLRKRGFTLEEIAKYCDISKSTASNWLKNKTFSEQITKQNTKRAGQENAKRLKLISKSRMVERTKRYIELERSAETEFKHYKKNPLFIAGLMLYSGNGDLKDRHILRLSTTNMDSHSIFIKFAKEYLGVSHEKFKFWLLLYANSNENTCMKNWKHKVKIPYSQWHRNQFVNTLSKKKTLHFGVGNTIIASTVLKQKLIKWIELAQKDLSK